VWIVFFGFSGRNLGMNRIMAHHARLRTFVSLRLLFLE
jgi:hypothetical protein